APRPTSCEQRSPRKCRPLGFAQTARLLGIRNRRPASGNCSCNSQFPAPRRGSLTPSLGNRLGNRADRRSPSAVHFATIHSLVQCLVTRECGLCCTPLARFFQRALSDQAHRRYIRRNAHPSDSRPPRTIEAGSRGIWLDTRHTAERKGSHGGRSYRSLASLVARGRGVEVWKMKSLRTDGP